MLIYDALGRFNPLTSPKVHPPISVIIFFFLCIGVGLSSTPDGIAIVQRSVDIEIAAALLQGLKTSWDGHQFGKIVGVGHGYGRYGSSTMVRYSAVHLIHSFLSVPLSSQLLGVAEKYSGLLDGMVLMSSAPDVPSLLTSFAASSIGIASLNNRNRFGEHGPT